MSFYLKYFHLLDDKESFLYSSDCESKFIIFFSAQFPGQHFETGSRISPRRDLQIRSGGLKNTIECLTKWNFFLLIVHFFYSAFYTFLRRNLIPWKSYAWIVTMLHNRCKERENRNKLRQRNRRMFFHARVFQFSNYSSASNWLDTRLKTDRLMSIQPTFQLKIL